MELPQQRAGRSHWNRDAIYRWNWNLTPYASLTGFTADNPEYIYPMAWNRNQSIPAVYIVNWRNAELQHASGERYGSWAVAKAAVRKEFVDDNRVKVNSDGISSIICRADVEYTRQVLKPLQQYVKRASWGGV